MAITLEDKVMEQGREWQLYCIEFKSDDKTMSAYFYALSREHASYMLAELKENGKLSDDIVATGKFD